ncbi:BON domain-containing protein [Paraburkholderia sp. J94]|uniref:BON domain-containing protein n=1 Tax=Paraburkholderia sp. J94 TaxID=2805441 RepID=UPI002AB1BBF7|nr:BON domain-containing protein [Paraburkholderia sp. J94]
MKQRTLARVAAAAFCIATITASLSAHAQGGSAAQADAASTNPQTQPQTHPQTQTNAASTKAADRALAGDVRHALRAARKQGLKASFIRVRAHDGDVTLTGVVADAKQIDFAVSIAQGVSGVRSVTTKITIRDGESIKGSQ